MRGNNNDITLSATRRLSASQQKGFAYVKFRDGPLLNKNVKVNASQVQSKLGANLKFHAKGKYPVKHDDGNVYKAQILFTAETEAELEELIKKNRIQVVPLSQLQTESESDNEQKIKKVKSSLGNDEKEKSQLQKYVSLADAKLMDVKVKLYPIQVVTSNQNNYDKNMSSEENSNHSENKPVENESPFLSEDEFVPDEQPLNKIDKEQVDEEVDKEQVDEEVDKEQVDEELDKEQVDEELDKGQVDEELDKEQVDEELDKGQVDEEVDEKQLDNKKENRNLNKVLNKKVVKVIQVLDEKKYQQNVKELNEQRLLVQKLEKKNKTLSSENNKLQNNNHELQKKNKRLKKELKEYQDLNKILQKKNAEKVEEGQIIAKQLQDDTVALDMDPKKNFVPIGKFRESDKTYHIGRDTWIREGVYNEIMKDTNRPAQCVGLIIKAIFGEKILMSSTISGRESNRKIGRNKLNNSDSETEGSNQQTSSVNKLDDTMLALSFDLYVHWLKNHKKTNKKFDLMLEITNFNSYVSKKISYLKRPPQKRKKSKADDESGSDNDLPKKSKVMERTKKTQKTNVKRITHAQVHANVTDDDITKVRDSDSEADEDAKLKTSKRELVKEKKGVLSDEKKSKRELVKEKKGVLSDVEEESISDVSLVTESSDNCF